MNDLRWDSASDGCGRAALGGFELEVSPVRTSAGVSWRFAVRQDGRVLAEVACGGSSLSARDLAAGWVLGWTAALAREESVTAEPPEPPLQQ